MSACNICERTCIRQGTGGRLRVDECYHLGIGVSIECLLKLSGVNGLTPFVIDRNHLCTQATRHLGHPLTENTILRDDNLVAGFKQIDKAGLHAGGAGTGDWKGKPIRGLESVPQQVFNFPHQTYKSRIHMANRRLRKCLQHPGINF